MRKLKILSVLLSVCGVLLIGSAVALQLFTPIGDMHPEFLTGSQSFDNVREIIVVTGALPVRLEFSDSDSCEVQWKSGLPLITSCDEYGTLKINEDDSFTLSLFSKESDDSGVTVKVPVRGYERISLATSGGDIICSDVSTDSLEISTRSGDILVAGADERTKIRSESGNITFSTDSFTGEMTINGGSGQINAYLDGRADFFAEFITEGGYCTSYGFDKNVNNRKGDAALLSGKGINLLRIYTKTGNLVIARENN